MRFALAALERAPVPRAIVDVGACSGVGGVITAHNAPGARLTLLDINPLAVELACINAEAAGVAAQCLEGSTLAAVNGPVDLVLANPPFIIDDQERT